TARSAGPRRGEAQEGPSNPTLSANRVLRCPVQGGVRTHERYTIGFDKRAGARLNGAKRRPRRGEAQEGPSNPTLSANRVLRCPVQGGVRTHERYTIGFDKRAGARLNGAKRRPRRGEAQEGPSNPTLSANRVLPGRTGSRTHVASHHVGDFRTLFTRDLARRIQSLQIVPIPTRHAARRELRIAAGGRREHTEDGGRATVIRVQVDLRQPDYRDVIRQWVETEAGDTLGVDDGDHRGKALYLVKVEKGVIPRRIDGGGD